MKIIFRKVKESDLEKIRSWRTKPEVSRYMYTDPSITAEEQLQWFRRIDSDSTKKYWIVNVDGQDLGLALLYDIDLRNKRASWAYYIGEENYRGIGVGKNIELNILSYVFDTLSLNKLCCEVLVENERVVKIHEKFGSKVEGIRRQHVLKGDEYKDIVEMGILKEEWESIKDNFEYIKGTFVD